MRRRITPISSNATTSRKTTMTPPAAWVDQMDQQGKVLHLLRRSNDEVNLAYVTAIAANIDDPTVLLLSMFDKTGRDLAVGLCGPDLVEGYARSAGGPTAFACVIDNETLGRLLSELSQPDAKKAAENPVPPARFRIIVFAEGSICVTSAAI